MSEVDTVEVTNEKPAAKKRSANKPSRVKVIFHNQDGDLGKGDIFVSVNGYAYQIKRNEPVDLPPEVIEVIDAEGKLNDLAGKEFDGISRTTFVIDEKGIIEDIIEKVKTKEHTSQILK